MTAPDQGRDTADLMKRSLLEVRRLRGRLDELERAAVEPIAIVGLGCRFPGAEDPDSFWNLLASGRDAIAEVPANRWDVEDYYDPDPTAPGKVYVREGGFLSQIDRFDAQVFNVSPREAATMDPQQRLLLEVAWEALESACVAPDSLYGSQTGVFVGIGSFEYAAHIVRRVDITTIDPHFGTGTALSAAAGRLSFTFGLTGPSLAVDTACSSSLVSVHLACQSLRNRECDLALAAGVSVMLAPEVNIAFAKARLLSADGRCHTFDAAADGYGRGEGCGVVVLKRLSDALAQGDRIITLVRGSAVNQDGPSGALVVPNGVAQQAVIRRALENARIGPDALDYLEAHGTGTALGDPIEVGALAQVFGADRPPQRPLIIGSVKTNFGHLESAAGIAGLIKTALALQHEMIPAHLHFREPNPRIAWDQLPATVPTEPVPWPRGTRPRIAGVSSFGFTGTNAHVILEEPPVREVTTDALDRPIDRPVHVLTLSAKSPQALRDLAGRYEAYVASTDAALGDICFSANVGRARLRHRLAIVAGSHAELRERLQDFLSGRDAPGLYRRDGAASARRKTAFLLTALHGDGSGSEIGRELRETHASFRDALAARSTQPLLVAVQQALAEFWKSLGIQPASTWTWVQGTGNSHAEEAIRALHRNGCNQFIDMSPDARLLDVVRTALPNQGVAGIASLRSGRSEVRQLAEAVAQLSLQDRGIDWLAFDRGYARQRISLPLYPFQRERFWIGDDPASKPARTPAPAHAESCYRVEWVAQSPEASTSSTPVAGDRAPGRRVVVVLPQAAGVRVAADLSTRLAAAVSVPVSVVVADGTIDTEEARERIAHASDVVYIGALGDTATPDLVTPEHATLPQPQPTASAACAGALRVIQTLTATRFVKPPRLWLVTRGAQAVTADDDLPGVSEATMWGLGSVAAVELPELRCTMIDLDPAADLTAQLSRLLDKIQREAPVEDTALRADRRYVRRLVRESSLPTTAVTVRPDGRYLVTGGTGAIGLRLARWLVTAGARALILLGRSEPSDAVREQIDELRHLGADVTFLLADVSRAEQLASLPALTGVIHCAGLFGDRLLPQHRWELFEDVFAAKVRGTWHLHEATRAMPLDFFAVCSSSASMLPTPGMAAYTAANAYQDALMHYRRRHGLPGLSISWGPWQDVGMAQRAGRARLEQWRAHGMSPLAPAQALDVFGRLLAGPHAHVGVFSIDWPQLVKVFPEGAVPPYLGQVAIAPPAAAPASETFLTLRAMPASERAPFLEVYLRGHVARLLGPDVHDLPAATNLAEAGVDSLMIMDVLNTLRNDLRFVLYPRELYGQPTISGLAAYLAAEFERTHGTRTSPSAPAAVPASAAPAPAPTAASATGPATVAAPTAAPAPAPAETPLPPIAFILSSPRAGSTLLRVMLAGHPRLFSPPELHLLPFSTMAERETHLGRTHLGEGLQRALMDLTARDADSSRAQIEQWVTRNVPIRDVYAALQDWAGDRLLIDKSPTHAVSAEVLARAERLCDAKYIHLVRHPYAVIESFVRLRMDKLAGIDAPDPYVLAEQIWTTASRNILDLARVVARERYHLVIYEELVRDPLAVLGRLCDFLGVPWEPALLEPYAGQRMTDGIHAVSMPIGDPNFLTHESIDARLAEAWREIDLGRRLGAETTAVAAALGYDLPRDRVPASASTASASTAPASTALASAATTVTSSSPAAATPCSSSPAAGMTESYVETPRGLRLCLCSWGPADGPIVLLLHGVLSQGASWEEIATSLAQRGLRAIAPDLRGHGRSDHVGRGSLYHGLDFVADLDAIAAAIGRGPFVLVGHSMGAAIAMLFATARPAAVSSLILIEPPLPDDPESTASDTQARLATQLDHLAQPATHPVLADVDAAAARLQRAIPGLSSALAHTLAARDTIGVDNGVIWRWDPQLRSRAGLGFGNDRTTAAQWLDLLRQMRMPLTIVTGHESRTRADTTAFLDEASRTHARLVHLEGGHHVHLEQPLVLADLVVQAASQRRMTGALT